MFTELRRTDKARSVESAEEILAGAAWGMLALTLESGYPYCVPVSHIYLDGCVYFHSAVAGQKYEALLREPKVCFSAVGETTRVLPGKFTVAYASAVAFGRAGLVEDEAETIRVLELITAKADPTATAESTAGYIRAHRVRCCVFKITIERLTGKGLG